MRMGGGKPVKFQIQKKFKEEEKKKKGLFTFTESNIKSYSERYQWLPSNFEISEEGEVKIRSYINNLHPTNKSLYSLIERIFEKFIPLFNNVISDLNEPRRPRIDPPDTTNQTYYSQKISPFSPPEKPTNPFDLRGRNVQAIIKFADIILTRKNSKYKGGNWHVEGMENENIISTGIYYFKSENITESSLHFRASGRKKYGYESGALQNQYLGSVITNSGRMIAFPNIYQHQVSPFELLDTSKEGHRKIMVIFLVDPATKIISTSEIAPQRSDFYFTTLKSIGGPFLCLPNEILIMISNYLEVFSFDEAKKHRLNLMEERARFVDQKNKVVIKRTFNFCEH